MSVPARPRAGDRDTMRVFLAVFPPPEVQAAAAAAIEALRASTGGAGVSWVRQANLHFTLRFLGELGEDGARRAGEAAREAAAGQPPFALALEGLGAFPSAARARALWIGASEGAESLRALARALDAALKTRGFGPADKPFTPHLTIGRVRERGADWAAVLARIPSVRASFTVERILVVKSTLSPGGSLYKTLEELPMGGSSD